MISFIKMGLRRDIILRSLKVSLVVGTILVIINKSGIILQGNLDFFSVIQILLTYLVPFLVSEYSSISMLYQAEKQKKQAA